MGRREELRASLVGLLRTDPSGISAVSLLKEVRQFSEEQKDKLFFEAEKLAYPEIIPDYPSWPRRKGIRVPAKNPRRFEGWV